MDNNKYYKDGQLKESRSYKNNLRHGQWINYYKNGQIHYKQSYTDGKLHGEKFSYYQDGTLAFQCSFNFGKRDCNWIYFSDKGKIVKNILYKNGKLI